MNTYIYDHGIAIKIVHTRKIIENNKTKWITIVNPVIDHFHVKFSWCETLENIELEKRISTNWFSAIWNHSRLVKKYRV